VQLGRDTFSKGIILPRTADAVFAALDGFRHIMDGYGVGQVRAVATSAVREARNGDLFLDRVARNRASASRSSTRRKRRGCSNLAIRESLKRHPAMKGAWTLLSEVGAAARA